MSEGAGDWIRSGVFWPGGCIGSGAGRPTAALVPCPCWLRPGATLVALRTPSGLGHPALIRGGDSPDPPWASRSIFPAVPPKSIHSPARRGTGSTTRAVSEAKVSRAKQQVRSPALIISAVVSARVFAQTGLLGGSSLQVNLFSPIPKLLSPSSSPLCAYIYE